MSGKVKKLADFLVDDPGKVWVYGLFPLFGLVAMLCLIFGNCSVFTPDQIGYRLFGEDDFAAAADRFADPSWQAAAHYRNADFKEAAAIYGGYDSAEGTFNHGNSLVMLGKYEEAVQRYDRALELRPGWQAAESNREIAAIRAERVRQEGGEMTGGQLEADEIVFTDTKSSSTDQQEVVEAGQELSDAEMRAVWLRNVQTEPADFLRAKFAYQQATKAQAQSGQEPSR